ncbi:related to beta (1-3) glucanosyltransferase [Rhynchosporium agropyri]|uniref:1,3-beta-glucanosyltransferase n=1 Tax=Rhynchosporium agropyri TaxID=914238 RepID=A0A1E1JR73_9HELO|nr:related to beta (1-3) glucanosyltransferase [Rhynchosporium agropyri]
MFKLILSIALLACLTLQASALPTITVKGSKFFADGKQFFLKGVAYQGTPDDPLVDTRQCQLDAKLMSSIGTNSIRVYHVDPFVAHDGCMSAFNDAGIYIWLDLDTFTTQIVQATPTWTKEQFGSFAKVMDAFHQYDNLGGFWIGNEIITSLGGSNAAPFIKAAVADIKAYENLKRYRDIPVGYSAADIAELRPMLQNYLACGSPESAIDFFGLNSYEWCGTATYETSGYGGLQAMALNYSLPIFFSETGCNVGGDRTFNDQKAIFGSEMMDTWSGSIIYEWVQETNDYGLVDYPNGQIYSGAPREIQPDFDNLKNVWKDTSPVGVEEGSYTPKFSPPTCPSATGGWTVDGDVPLPRLGSEVVKAVADGAQYGTQPSTPRSTPTSLSSTMVSTGMPTAPLFSACDPTADCSASDMTLGVWSSPVSVFVSQVTIPQVISKVTVSQVVSQVTLTRFSESSGVAVTPSALVPLSSGVELISPAGSISSSIDPKPTKKSDTISESTPSLSPSPTYTLPGTGTAAPAATTTSSQSAGTALRAFNPGEWIKKNANPGVKSGLVVLIFLILGFLFISAAFL